MTAQQAAILKLLADDDRQTLALIKAQFLARGREALAELQGLEPHAMGRARANLADLISEIERGHVDAIFEELCATFREHGNLEEAAWRLAATFLPGEDFGPARQQLDDWGKEVSKRLLKADGEEERIETLVEYLSHEVRFRGNEADYYNLNNSLLPEVIETRHGIPITLSLIYILVGQRAGLLVQGVGLPGHFIIRCGEAFFDPFHGGRRLSLGDCRMILEQRNFELTPDQLAPATARQILARMLANIHRLAEPSDPPLAAKLGRWMEALSATSRSR